MKTVKEVSKTANVSVRTLHYYDEIGLLRPSTLTETGYRLYDEDAMKRLHAILLFRELGFGLGEIRKILDDPGFDTEKALDDQIRLLEMRIMRAEKMIAGIKKMKKSGKDDFAMFDNSEAERYKKEAKERWGSTGEYREYEKRGDTADIMPVFAGFGELKELPPEDEKVQRKVKELQDFISGHYYPCRDAVLASLAEMYVNDERFRKNIDAAGGEGTAEFVRRAVGVFCGK